MGMGPQGNAEYVAMNANLVFPYPDNIDPREAGGMPIVFLTAYHLLRTRGKMKQGDTILIQAGASGVGTVATQMAKAWGAKVITTASTSEKLELSKSLGSDHTINYTTEDFEEQVQDITEGKGVQLILECVGGNILEKSIKCIAPYGQILSYGNASGITANIHSSDFTSDNRSITGFSMGRSPVGTLNHSSAMSELTPMIANGSLRLIVDQIQTMSQVSAAHEHLSNRGSKGKVILVPQ
jgi:NADPH2:quinone reductase